jgi:hypothetical protein
LDQPKFFVRGPRLPAGDVQRGNYFSLVGAAETVGVHVREPYGALLAERLRLPCLNLGKGGAGVAFFSRPEMGEIVAKINKGKFLVLTVMSGRQTGNSLITACDGTCRCVHDGREMTVERAWEKILEAHWHDRDYLAGLVRELRRNYVVEYLRFLRLVEVPAILFYFSQRRPGYDIDWSKKNRNSLWATFPHFVDDAVLAEIRAGAGGRIVYRECVSRRGIPYVLRDKTGKVIPIWYEELGEYRTRHGYYPSPEMHRDAAAALEPLCRKLLAANSP